MGQSDDRYVIPARFSWWISDETSLDRARDQDDVNSLARVARSTGRRTRGEPIERRND